MNYLQKWLLICMSIFTPAVLAWSVDGNMPSVLLHDATARGCDPVKGFYDRDGITLPPFFFDQQLDNQEYPVAYVCEREKRYFLVLLPVASSACKQRELALGHTMPGGLAAFTHRLSLSVFHRVDNLRQEQKYRDVAEVTSFRPLVIDYDGVQRVFYCSEGQWLEARFE